MDDIIVKIHKFLEENPTEFVIVKVKGEKTLAEKMNVVQLSKRDSEQKARDKTFEYVAAQLNLTPGRSSWYYRKPRYVTILHLYIKICLYQTSYFVNYFVFFNRLYVESGDIPELRDHKSLVHKFKSVRGKIIFMLDEKPGSDATSPHPHAYKESENLFQLTKEQQDLWKTEATFEGKKQEKLNGTRLLICILN